MILSKCLDQLYTTTRRRGAVENIDYLNRELDAWGRNFNLRAEASIRFSNQEGRQSFKEKLMSPSLRADSMVLWLFILEELTSILINRPALSLQRAVGKEDEPKHHVGLERCVQSAFNIIQICDLYRSEGWIFHLWPFGSQNIAQSALMLLYNHWVTEPTLNTPKVGNGHLLPTYKSEEKAHYMVMKAVDILMQRFNAVSSTGVETPLAEVANFLADFARLSFNV